MKSAPSSMTPTDGKRRMLGSRRVRLGRGSVLSASVLLVAATVAVGSPAAASGHLQLVADGLANPRGVAVGPGDRVFVAEAGRGGETRVDVTMANGTNPICVGQTGAITEIRAGRQRTLADLPSWSGADEDGKCPGSGHGAIGAHGVAVNGLGNLSHTVGLAADPALRPDIAAQVEAASLFGTAHRLLPNGRSHQLGDLAAFEQGDWDGAGPDSNPYGIAILPDGSRLVADAGGNTLVRLHPDGETSLVAVFAPNCVPWELAFPNPIPENQNPCGTSEEFPAQAVPTGVAVGDDGEYYVSELRGFPFTPGTSRVWKVDADPQSPASCSTFAPVPNQGCEVYADGMTSLVDVAFGPDNTLYAVQIADEGVWALETGGSAAGSVQAIAPGGGSPTASVGGLTAPGGVGVDGDELYVTNFSIFPEQQGQLVRTATP